MQKMNNFPDMETNENTDNSTLDDLLAEIEKTDRERDREKAELEALGETFEEAWTYYTEDDRDEPIDDIYAKIPDILAHLKGLEVIEHTNAEEQFKDWDDWDHLLEVKNPDGGESLEIDVGEDDRFSLFYGGWHSHFRACKGDYFEMLDTIVQILSNNVCAVMVSSGRNSWLGCDLTHRKYTSADKPEIVLKRTLLCREFEDEVHISGGKIKVTYWDSSKNCSFFFKQNKDDKTKQPKNFGQ